MRNAKRVREFYRAVGSTDPPIPTQPNDAVLSLRRALIEEEGREALEAFARLQAAPQEGGEAAFYALVHELTDLLYVTYGALIAFRVEPDGVLPKFTGPI